MVQKEHLEVFFDSPPRDPHFWGFCGSAVYLSSFCLHSPAHTRFFSFSIILGVFFLPYIILPRFCANVEFVFLCILLNILFDFRLCFYNFFSFFLR